MINPALTDFLAVASACYLFMNLCALSWWYGQRLAERRRHAERLRAALASIPRG